MNQCFCSGGGEGGTNTGNIFEVKEGSFGDVIDMSSK